MMSFFYIFLHPSLFLEYSECISKVYAEYLLELYPRGRMPILVRYENVIIVNEVCPQSCLEELVQLVGKLKIPVYLHILWIVEIIREKSQS